MHRLAARRSQLHQRPHKRSLQALQIDSLVRFHVQSLFDAKEPSRSSGGQVTFEAGARSAWHTHPLGQVLIVTEGVGWIQQWGGPVQVIRKGDVVGIPAGVKHWHGATPTSAMTHIAFQEQLDGITVNWLERVTDEQYRLTK